MNKDWVLDVLADLRTFARQNEMPSLAEQLDDTIMIAAADVRRTRRQPTGSTISDERKTRDPDQWFATGENSQ